MPITLANAEFKVRTTGKARETDDWFKIAGAIGIFENDVNNQGAADATAMIQASIDDNYASEYKRTMMPRGRFFKTTSTLFLDPPGSLRPSGGDAAWNSGTTYAADAVVSHGGFRWTSLQASNTNRTPGFNSDWWENRANNFQFSMKLEGEGMGTTTNPCSATFRPDFGNLPVVYVGPGQGCEVHGIGIWGTVEHAEGGHGIAVAGGSSGASNTSIRDCFVYNMSIAYSIGVNSDALGDSNTYFRCDGAACGVGFYIPRTQNYIVEIISCRMQAKFAVLSPVGKDTFVRGGNMSNGTCDRKEIAVSAVSAATRYSRGRLGSGYHNYKMDWTLGSTPTGLNQHRFFDRFAAETASFGVIPLMRADSSEIDNDNSELDSWNAGASKLTLAFSPTWLCHNYGLDEDITTITSLIEELQDCTVLYAVDANFTFWGTGIKVYGNHIENPSAYTCLLTAKANFDGGTTAVLSDLYFNYDAALGDNYFDTTGDNRAWWLCQQVHPIIDIHNGNVVLEKSDMGQSNVKNRLCIDTLTTAEFTVRDMHGSMAGPNMRIWAAGNQAWDVTRFHPSLGAGVWEDGSPFLPHSFDGNDADMHWHIRGPGRVPFEGFYPKKGTVLSITPDQYAQVDGAGPTDDPGEYVPIYGRYLYQVFRRDAAVGSLPALVISDHQGLSYGKSLMGDWSHKGASTCVYMDAALLDLMRQGLKIRPKNASGRNAWYIVNGIYRIPTDDFAGYVTVTRTTDTPWLEGDKDTTYTGDEIEQEAYAFSEVAWA